MSDTNIIGVQALQVADTQSEERSSEPRKRTIRTTADTAIAGYVAIYRRALDRMDRLISSRSPETEEEMDRLLQEQCANVATVTDLPADTVEGVLAKLDMWFADKLNDGRDQPEDEGERLVASARADLKRLLG